MPESPPDAPAWTLDPSLTDDQRWQAFKIWQAAERVKFRDSARARKEYAAWAASKPKPLLGPVRQTRAKQPVVHRFS